MTLTTSGDVVPRVQLGITNNAFAIESDANGCVLSNDTQISSLSDDLDDMMVNQNTYNIEKSNGVVIGPVSHFHCPVTIIQRSDEAIGHLTSSDKNNGSDGKCEHQCNGNQSPSPTERRRSTTDSTRARYIASLIQYKSGRKVPLVLLGIALTAAIFVVASVIVYTGESAAEFLNETVLLPKDPTLEPNLNASEPQFIPRKFWGARPPLYSRKLETPVKYFIVAHTGGGSTCETVAECSSILQSLQSYAVEHKSPDIGYNFLIGGDGNIYIGRGWDSINYLRNRSLCVAYIGDFTYDPFTPKMQEALKKLLSTGVTNGKLAEDYTLLSHSQTTASISPGVNIREIIEKWPHYYDKEYIEI